MKVTAEHAKYAKDTALAIAIRPIEWIEPLILLPILTKTLGVQNYGIWSQLNVTVSLLVPVSTLGLAAAMDRFLGAMANPREVSRNFFSILTAVALVSMLLSLLTFAAARPLAETVFGGIGAEPYIKIGAFLVFFMVISGISNQYFISLRHIKWYAAFSIIQIILELSSLSYLALNGFGLYSIIIAVMSIRFFVFILGIILIKTQIPFTMPKLNNLKPFLAFGSPLLFGIMCVWLFDLSNRYVIGYFLDVSWVGIYSVSYQIGSIITFFWAPFGVVLLPAIAPLYEKKDLAGVRVYLSHSLKFFLALVIPSIFGLAVLSKTILITLTTPDFVSGYSVILLVAVAKALLSVGLFLQMILMLAKKTGTVSIVFAVTAALNLVLNIILIPRLGILGAAIATLISFLVHFAMLYTLGAKLLPFDVDLKFIAKSLVSSIIMGIAVYFIKAQGLPNLIISVAAGAVIYFAVLALLRGFSKGEYRLLRSLV